MARHTAFAADGQNPTLMRGELVEVGDSVGSLPRLNVRETSMTAQAGARCCRGASRGDRYESDPNAKPHHDRDCTRVPELTWLTHRVSGHPAAWVRRHVPKSPRQRDRRPPCGHGFPAVGARGETCCDPQRSPSNHIRLDSITTAAGKPEDSEAIDPRINPPIPLAATACPWATGVRA